MDDELFFLDIYAGILKMSETFCNESKVAKLSYDFTSPKLKILKERYGLDKIAGTGTDFEKARNILFWLSNNVYHFSNYDNHIQSDSLSILEYSFKKGEEFGVNCKALSVILTECLLALGIHARTIYIMPFSPYDSDNHVVTHAYIKELNNWIMLDPTFNCYALDNNRNPLNLLEMRTMLGNGKQILFNEEINYNGQKTVDYVNGAISIEAYCREYFSKNLFYMQTKGKSNYGADKLKGVSCVLLPKNYDLKKSFLSRMEFKASMCNDESTLQKMQNYIVKLKNDKAKNPCLSPEMLLEPQG